MSFGNLGGVQHYIFEFFKNIVTSFTHSPTDGFQVVPSGWQNTRECTSPVHLSGLLSPAGESEMTVPCKRAPEL